MRELRSAVRTGALILSIDRSVGGSRPLGTGQPISEVWEPARGTRAAPGRQADYISIRAHNLE